MAVIAGEAHLATGEELVEAAGVVPVAEAEQDAGGNVLRRERAAQQRQRRDSNPTPDQNRPRGPNCINFSLCWVEKLMQFAGGGEGVAQGAVDPDALARLELAEAVGAGADALDQEVEADAAGRWSRLGDRER